MKDLEKDVELERYRTPAPQESVLGLNIFFPGSKVYCFEFPEGDAFLRTMVSMCKWKGSIVTSISASFHSNNGCAMRALRPNDVYLFKDYLQNPDECLVWQYNPIREQMRAAMYRRHTRQNFDMNNFVLYTHEFNGDLPPLKEAYEKEVEKGKGKLYAKGTIGQWKFVHVYTKEPFPWAKLQMIADKEFGNNLVQVFFNQETREHPNEFVIWYHPNAEYLL